MNELFYTIFRIYLIRVHIIIIIIIIIMNVINTTVSGVIHRIGISTVSFVRPVPISRY